MRADLAPTAGECVIARRGFRVTTFLAFVMILSAPTGGLAAIVSSTFPKFPVVKKLILTSAICNSFGIQMLSGLFRIQQPYLPFLTKSTI